jgi:hypothetical protein
MTTNIHSIRHPIERPLAKPKPVYGKVENKRIKVIEYLRINYAGLLEKVNIAQLWAEGAGGVNA